MSRSIDRDADLARQWRIKAAAAASAPAIAEVLAARLATSAGYLAEGFPPEVRDRVRAALCVQAELARETCLGLGRRWGSESLVLQGRLQEIARGAAEGAFGPPGGAEDGK